jgi:gliding motility-associated-like protein
MGTDTVLNGSATGGSGSYSYSWEPADSLINPNVQNPTTIILTSSTVFTLTVTDLITGCQNTDQITVTITGGLLSVIASANPLSICIGDSTQLYALASGGSGTYAYLWSSNPLGFASTLINPVVSPIVTTTYSVTVDDGFNNTNVSITVIVNPLPIVSFNGLNSDYCIDASSAILTGNPAGGLFSGDGISGNSFYPSIAGSGIHNITYTYTNGNGCTDSQTQNVTVNDLPVVSFNGLDTAYCIDVSSATLTGVPAGGIFTGDGIAGNTFDPSVAGLGNHNITYTYINANGCINSSTQSVTVNDLPIVDFAGLDTAYCIDVLPVILTGFPTGGAFSGPGISGNTFNPLTAGLGTHNITYTYTNGNGCVNSNTQSVTVNDVPIVSFSGLNVAYCIDASSATLTGVPAGGIFNGDGMTGNTFDPSAAGLGNHNITYTYINANGCTDSDMQIVTINNLPVVSFSGLSSDYCIDALSVTLTGNPLGGLFSGDGIAGNTFDPSAAGLGNHNITYTYTDANGCTDSQIQLVTVNDLPIVSFSGLDTAYCIDAPFVILTGSPAGGIFNGNGVSGNTFYPSIAGSGNYNITYTYTDANGCIDSQTQSVTVNDLPIVNFSGLDTAYCIDAPSVTLTGVPAGGIFSGDGITGNTFDPSAAGLSNHNITYIYIDANGCINSNIQTVTVNNLPVVNFSGLNSVYCFSYPTETLTGYPLGGTFSGPGIIGNVFNPATAGVGTHDITYTYTDGNGCINYDTQSTTINPDIPANVSISANPSTTICEGNAILFTASSTNGGNLTYQWQVNGTDILGATDSTYSNTTLSNGDTITCKLTSDEICIIDNPAMSNALIITVNDNPVADAGTDVDICYGNSTIIDASASSGTPTLLYNWDNGLGAGVSHSVYPPSTTTYAVTVTDGNGCTNTDDVIVTVTSTPAPPVVPDVLVCMNEDVTLAVVDQGLVYEWFDIPVGGTSLHTGITYTLYNVTSEATYYVQSFTTGGCHDTIRTPVNIYFGEEPIADFIASETIIMEDDEVQFTNLSQNAEHFYWAFGDGNSSEDIHPSHIYTLKGMYSVMLIAYSTDNCRDTIIKTNYINVSKQFEIFVPTAFSPNNDGENDMLYVIGEGINDMKFMVYNRLGVKIFESNKQLVGWNGKYEGIDQPEGNYLYILNVNTVNGQNITQQGMVTLIR